MFDLTTTNTEQTMSSLDFLNNIINPARVAAGESEVANRHFIVRVEDELDDLGAGKTFTRYGNTVKYYELTFEQMTLVGMRESKAVRRSVLETLKKLQKPKQELNLNDPKQLLGLLQNYAERTLELENKVVVQDTVIAVQEEQLESLHNLFTEGMSPTKFARQLNGVNSNEMLKYLIDIGWIYRRDWESKKTGRTGTNWYSYGNVRGKYLRDISYTPYKGALPVYHVELLKEGAVKLYEMYLDGKLPMKKGWDGKFTHDVL